MIPRSYLGNITRSENICIIRETFYVVISQSAMATRTSVSVLYMSSKPGASSKTTVRLGSLG